MLSGAVVKVLILLQLFKMASMMEWEDHTQHFLTEIDGCRKQSTCAIELWAQPAAFSMEHQFHLKETLTNCGYVDLGIWQTLTLKMKKWIWPLKQLTVFAANDKIPTFKQKLELQKTWLPW